MRRRLPIHRGIQRQNHLGSTIMRVDGSGNVGIGTDSPTQHQSANETVLHIADSNVASLNLDSTATNGDCYVLSSTGSGDFRIFNDDTNTTVLNIDDAGNVGIGTTSPNAILDISDATNDNLRIGTRGGNMNLFSVTDAGAASPLAFEGSQFNFITGNVGIGTTSPAEKLEVTGDIFINGGPAGGRSLALKRTGATNTWKLVQGHTGVDYLEILEGSNTRFSIKNGGNVGIGTTSPAARLNVKETGAANTAIFENSGQAYAYAAIKVNEAVNNKAVLSFAVGDALASTHIQAEIQGLVTNNGGALTGDLVFKTNQGDNMQERMRILANGKVGIGTASPTANLDVVGSSIFRGTVHHSWFNYSTGEDTYIRGGKSTSKVYINDSNAADVVIASGGGNVGIGTTTPSAKLEVNGHFAATTKSFIIDNPKTDGRLQYGVVETDEHSVYVRGKSDQEEIQLPEEWEWLVHEDSVTALVTAVGQTQRLFVIEETNKKITVGGLADGGRYNYVVYGTRKDVDALEKHLK